MDPPPGSGLPGPLPERPERPDLPLPATPGFPAVGQAPAKPSGRPLLIGAVVFAVVAVVALLLSGGGGGPWPDELAGYERLETSELRAALDAIESLEFGDIGVEAAFYGDGGSDEPAILVQRYTGDTALMMSQPLEQIFQGAAGGAELMGGGNVGQEAPTRGGSGGVDVICAAAAFPSDPTMGSFAGSACVWRSETVGIVLVNGLDPQQAIGFTTDVVDAIDG